MEALLFQRPVKTQTASKAERGSREISGLQLLRISGTSTVEKGYPSSKLFLSILQTFSFPLFFDIQIAKTGDLVNEVAKVVKTKKQAQAVVNSVFSTITKTLKKNGMVTLVGFGTLKVVGRKAGK